MGVVDYLISGPSDSFSSLRRDFYPQAPQPITLSDTPQPFSGTITSLSDDGQTKTAIIDNMTRVRTVSDRIFHAARERWSDIWLKTTVTAVITTLGGAGTLAASITLGVCVPPLLPLALVVGAVGLAVIGCGIFASVRAYQADEQYAAWKDVVDIARQQRIRAGREGFSYVHKEQLKSSVVNQAETKALWHQHLASCKAQFRQHAYSYPGLQAQIVKDFFNNSPLESSAVAYAFTNVPPQYLPSNTAYPQLHAKYRHICIAANAQKTHVYAQSMQQSNQIRAASSINSLLIHSTLGRHPSAAARQVHSLLQVGNSMTSAAAIGANKFMTNQRIEDISRHKDNSLSTLFTEIKSMLEAYPN